MTQQQLMFSDGHLWAGMVRSGQLWAVSYEQAHELRSSKGHAMQRWLLV
jgi:hypothetical protein